MTGETFFQLHYHLTDTEPLFDLAQGIAARRRWLKKHDARCRSFTWYARGLLRRGIAFLILAAVLGAMTALLELGGMSWAMAGVCAGCGVMELVLRGMLRRIYRRSWQQFRQHCRFQLFRFCKREHPLFHRDRRHWQGGPAGRRRELPVLPL